MNHLTHAAELAALFCGGILAGMEIVIHYGLRAPSDTLDARAQLQLRQALIYRLRVLVPAVFVPAAVSTIAATALTASGSGIWFRVASVTAIVLWIVVRIVGTVPINSATLEWKLDAPPKNWKALVDHAERFHIVGVWAIVVAFATALVAAAVDRGAW